MSTTEPLAIDYVDSHARLRGNEVEVVLCGLAEEVGDGAALVLSLDGTAVSAPAEVRTTGETSEVRARTPRNGLVDGHWSITLASDTHRAVDARLLVQGARPVVLLLGASAPPSVVPKAVPAPPAPTTGHQVARVGRAVLRRLPRPGRQTTR